MKHIHQMSSILLLVFTIVALTMVLYPILSFSNIAEAASGQSWSITDVNGHTGKFIVDSSGNFTGDLGTGSTPQGIYTIYIKNGKMSGTTITFNFNASYDNGQGTISGNSTGTLNDSYPSATSASGTEYGTITDPLGKRTFSINWTATRVSGSSSSGLSITSITDNPLFVGLIVGAPIVIAIVAISRARKNRQGKMKEFKKGNGKISKVNYKHERPHEYGVSPMEGPARLSTNQIPEMLSPDVIGKGGYPIAATGVIGNVPTGIPAFINLTGAYWTKEIQTTSGNSDVCKVNLNWASPQYDVNQYTFQEYNILQTRQVPTGQAQQIVMRTNNINQTSWQNQFNQTYQWNTAGDLRGYTIEALFKNNSTGTIETIRSVMANFMQSF